MPFPDSDSKGGNTSPDQWQHRAQAVAWQQQQQQQPRAVRASKTKESLRALVCDLHGISSDRVFLVRRIQSLGFGAAEVLRQHYSAYGAIHDVRAPRAQVKSKCQRFVRRTRPANLAFIVMADAAEVEAVIAAGHEQTVSGQCVLVERYEHRGIELEGPPDVVDGGCKKRCRSPSEESSRSVSTGTEDADESFNEKMCWADFKLDLESNEGCDVSSEFEYCATDDEWL